MESAEYFKNSVKVHINNDSGYSRFAGVVTVRFNKAELYDKFKPQLDYIMNLHKTMYGLRKYSMAEVQSFEEDKCAKFITDFDNMCSNSMKYTEQDFYKALGKMLNSLIKEYNSILSKLNNIKDTKAAEERAKQLEIQKSRQVSANNAGVNVSASRSVGNYNSSMFNIPSRDNRDKAIKSNGSTRSGGIPTLASLAGGNERVNNVITGNKPLPKLRFYVNPADKTFDKRKYMDDIEFDRYSIPKAFEKNLAWAVTQFPDKILREKIQSCIKYHRSFETFIDTEYDAILRFENLVTTYYLSLTYSLVSIPQSIADSDGKFMEVDKNLIAATDDYLKAIKEIVDKFMKKVDMTTKTQLDTFRNIVDSIV